MMSDRALAIIKLFDFQRATKSKGQNLAHFYPPAADQHPKPLNHYIF